MPADLPDAEPGSTGPSPPGKLFRVVAAHHDAAEGATCYAKYWHSCIYSDICLSEVYVPTVRRLVLPAMCDDHADRRATSPHHE